MCTKKIKIERSGGGGGGGLAFWDAVLLECMFFLPEMQCGQVNHVFKFCFLCLFVPH